MRLMRSLKSYSRLPRADRRVARSALSMLVQSRFALAAVPVDVWRERLRRRAARLKLPYVAEGAARTTAVRTGAIVQACARKLWPVPTCLHRAIVVEALLSAQGIRAQVRFGVRRAGQRLEAHSWAEYDGVALTPPGDDAGAYAPMQFV